MSILSEEGRRACARSLVRQGQGGRYSPTVLMQVTCSDGTAHELTEDELVAACSTGRSWAVCGAEITLAPLVALPGSRCMGCAAVLNPQPVRRQRPGYTRSVRRAVSGWLRMCAATRVLGNELAAPRTVERWYPMTEYRLLMAAVVALCALSAASGLWPGADVVCTSVVAGLGAGGLISAAARREMRIRRRLSAIRRRTAADAVSLVSIERVAS